MSDKKRKAIKLADSNDKPVLTDAGERRIISCKMTPERKRIFLDVLSKTASDRAAAEAATPWSESYMSGLNAFRKAREHDPEFAEMWDAAFDAAMAKLEQTAMHRALTSVQIPKVWQKTGEIVAYEEKQDNQHLQWVLSRLDPERWGAKKTVKHEHEGNVGILVVPGVAQTEDDWAKQIEEQAIDAEIVEEEEKPDE